jgi:DNA-binding NarL/FixJ family response regulator
VTITLAINPEIEAELLAKARARGMALQEYLQSIVEQQALPPGQPTTPSELTRREEAVRRMLEFGEKHHLSMGEPITRASLHKGHRY